MSRYPIVHQAVQSIFTQIQLDTIERIDRHDLPGKIIRMRGKGVPHLRSKSRGDQLVIVNITIPKKLDVEERELFEKLADKMDGKVLPQERGFLDRLKNVLGG